MDARRFAEIAREQRVHPAPFVATVHADRLQRAAQLLYVVVDMESHPHVDRHAERFAPGRPVGSRFAKARIHIVAERLRVCIETARDEQRGIGRGHATPTAQVVAVKKLIEATQHVAHEDAHVHPLAPRLAAVVDGRGPGEVERARPRAAAPVSGKGVGNRRGKTGLGDLAAVRLQRPQAGGQIRIAGGGRIRHEGAIPTAAVAIHITLDEGSKGQAALQPGKDRQGAELAGVCRLQQPDVPRIRPRRCPLHRARIATGGAVEATNLPIDALQRVVHRPERPAPPDPVEVVGAEPQRELRPATAKIRLQHTDAPELGTPARFGR